MLVEQPYTQGDTDQRVDDHQERLGDPQRPDVQRAMLFTDAANTVSNSIYRQAGYQPRGEHVEIEFAKRGLAPGH